MAVAILVRFGNLEMPLPLEFIERGSYLDKRMKSFASLMA